MLSQTTRRKNRIPKQKKKLGHTAIEITIEATADSVAVMTIKATDTTPTAITAHIVMGSAVAAGSIMPGTTETTTGTMQDGVIMASTATSSHTIGAGNIIAIANATAGIIADTTITSSLSEVVGDIMVVIMAITAPDDMVDIAVTSSLSRVAEVMKDDTAMDIMPVGAITDTAAMSLPIAAVEVDIATATTGLGCTIVTTAMSSLTVVVGDMAVTGGITTLITSQDGTTDIGATGLLITEVGGGVLAESVMPPVGATRDGVTTNITLSPPRRRMRTRRMAIRKRMESRLWDMDRTALVCTSFQECWNTVTRIRTVS